MIHHETATPAAGDPAAHAIALLDPGLYDPFAREYTRQLLQPAFRDGLEERVLEPLEQPDANVGEILDKGFIGKCVAEAAFAAAHVVLTDPEAIALVRQYHPFMILKPGVEKFSGDCPPTDSEILAKIGGRRTDNGEIQPGKLGRNAALGAVETFAMFDGIERKTVEFLLTPEGKGEDHDDIVSHSVRDMALRMGLLDDHTETVETLYPLLGVPDPESMYFRNMMPSEILDGTFSIPTDKLIIMGKPGHYKVVYPNMPAPNKQARRCPMARLHLPERAGLLMKVNSELVTEVGLAASAARKRAAAKVIAVACAPGDN